MKRVTPKGPGVKLNGKWCFNDQEEIISEEEYKANENYLTVLEDIRETNERVIEIVVKDETIDIKALKEDLEQFVENYNKPEEEEKEDAQGSDGNDKNVGGIEGAGAGNEGEDEELKALKAKAQELGINVTHNMKKETIKKKIEENEKTEDEES